MATTITSYGNWGNVGMGEYRLRITLSRTSVNIANNTSTVRSRVWVEARAGGWFTNISSTHGHSIDGTQVYSGSINRTVGQNSSTLILDNSRTVSHNAAGARTVASVGTFYNYATGNISVSTSLVLDTIPRATTPTTGGAAFVTGQAQTITLPRASTAFTHNLTYKVGTKTGTIATGAGASATWTPGNDLTTEFTKSASTTVTITTVTRSGSTTVGTKTNNFTLNAGSTIVPSISSVAWFDQNPKTTNVVGALVQGQSRVKGVITASGINGSTISTRRVAVSGVTYDDGTVIELPQSGTIPATGTVIDSRGRSATANASFSVLPYDVPRLGTGGFQVQRANTSWAPNDLGTNLIIDLHAIASSLKVSNVEKNLLTINVHTRSASGGTWEPRNTINSALLYNGRIQVTGGAQFPVQESFEVRITLNDKVIDSPTELITTIPTATVALDLNGTNVGVGKYHERGGLDVQGDIYSSSGFSVREGAQRETTYKLDKIVTPYGLMGYGFRGTTAQRTALGLSGEAVTGAVFFDTDTNQEYLWVGSSWVFRGYNYVRTLKFDTVGAFSFTKADYPGLRAVKVRVVGGGGSGGDGAGAGGNQHSAGGGGGGGGYAESFVLAEDIQPSTFIGVGRGGRDISGFAGGNGAGSSFGPHAEASGGGGGDYFAANGLMIGAPGGTGGKGVKGDLLITGDAGGMGSGYATLGHGGNGGSSHLGGGGKGNYTGAGAGNTVGEDGGQYGGGGAGGTSNSSGGKGRGGFGADGVVLIDLYM